MKALELAVAMIAGLVAVVILFALRIVGLIACAIGGFALLGVVISSMAWSHSHKPAQWLAVVHSGQMTALCLAVILVAWFGPMWLMQGRR